MEPEVEVKDGSERLYSKYNLALFEVLDKVPSGSTLDVEEHDEGPAAAVLRRRQRRQQQSNEGRSDQHVAKTVSSKRGALGEVEDTSDEHYRKLHRKPEYMERRIRNREIELYQYAQWQEGQRMGSERWRQLNSSHHHLAAHQLLGHVGGGSEAGGSDAAGVTQPQSRCASPLPLSAKSSNSSRVVADASANKIEGADLGDGTALINETLRRLDAMQTSETTSRKRFKSGMRNELRSLLDSSGYQDARARNGATNSNENNGGDGGGNDVSQAAARESTPPLLPVVASVSSAVSNTSIASVDVTAAGGEAVPPLTESERKVAHLGGSILEQLLIQAARLPPLAEDEASDSEEESEDEASSRASDDEEEDEDEASDGEDQSDTGNSSDDGQESSADSASGSAEAEDSGDSCCCPREFELPQRLFGHMTRQREQQRL
ncbi:hypothetical protein IWW37_001098 [Coemansia sp. RSA 2050]|nr:hypothetical protein IWW37_001098 [Coemansia sp. RSA 2050]